MPSPNASVGDRRTVLRGIAAAVAVGGLAGCLDADEEVTDDETADDNSTDTDGATNGSDSSDGAAESDDESAGATEVHAEYESTVVRAETPDGDELGEVTAAIADTDELRRLGLSDTEELPEDRGMLFVYDEVDERVFGMPDMSFGIDIVFADAEGVITSIAHAPEPGPDEDGSEQHYPGYGQYVLEVVYEWTADREVEEGDVLQFEL